MTYDPDGNRIKRVSVEYQAPSNSQTTTRKYIVDIAGDYKQYEKEECYICTFADTLGKK